MLYKINEIMKDYEILQETEKALKIKYYYFFGQNISNQTRSYKQQSKIFWIPKSAVLNDEDIKNWVVKLIKEFKPCDTLHNKLNIRFGKAPRRVNSYTNVIVLLKNINYN